MNELYGNSKNSRTHLNQPTPIYNSPAKHTKARQILKRTLCSTITGDFKWVFSRCWTAPRLSIQGRQECFSRQRNCPWLSEDTLKPNDYRNKNTHDTHNSQEEKNQVKGDRRRISLASTLSDNAVPTIASSMNHIHRQSHVLATTEDPGLLGKLLAKVDSLAQDMTKNYNRLSEIGKRTATEVLKNERRQTICLPMDANLVNHATASMHSPKLVLPDNRDDGREQPRERRNYQPSGTFDSRP
eukprot:gene9602-19960_t